MAKQIFTFFPIQCLWHIIDVWSSLSELCRQRFHFIIVVGEIKPFLWISCGLSTFQLHNKNDLYNIQCICITLKMSCHRNVLKCVQIQIFSFECRIAGSDCLETKPWVLCTRDEITQFACKSCLVRWNFQPYFYPFLATNKRDLRKLTKHPLHHHTAPS